MNQIVPYNINYDQTVNFSGTDVSLKKTPQIDPQWAPKFQIAMMNNKVKGVTDSDRDKAIINSTRTSREYTAATREQIKQYIDDHKSKLPVGLAKVAVMLTQENPPDSVNPDLITAFQKGFRTYQTSKNETRIAVSTGQMYKPGSTASGYDKVVLMKAKRIVRLIKQSIASHSMKADISLTKQFEAARGYFNTNKLRLFPSARINYMKNIIKKYGDTDQNVYRRGIATAYGRATSYIDGQSRKYQNINPNTIIEQQQTPEEAAFARFYFKDRVNVPKDVRYNEQKTNILNDVGRMYESYQRAQQNQRRLSNQALFNQIQQEQAARENQRLLEQQQQMQVEQPANGV